MSQSWQNRSYVVGSNTMRCNVTDNSETAALYSTSSWYWVLRGVIAFVTIFGNGLVIYLISARKPLREQASPNWFVMSLAVADFCVGAFNSPLNFVFAFYPECNRPTLTWAILGFFMNIFLDASIANLSLLTLDRYIAVVHPFTYKAFMSRNTVLALISAAWGITVILEIPYLILDLQQASSDTYFVHLVIYMVMFTFLPSVFMLYAYARILIVARRHRKEITGRLKRMASISSADTTVTNRGNKNGAMVTVGVIVVIFLLCNTFVQYRLTCFISPSCALSKPDTYVFFILRYINSAPNFVVYAFMKKDFRKELKILYRRHSCFL